MKLKNANVILGASVMQFKNLDVTTGKTIPLEYDQVKNTLTATLPDGKTTLVNLNLIPVFTYEEDDGKPAVQTPPKPKLELVKT
jgi:hypothetical protein